MYTRCPDCRTVFRITAAQLTQAFGQVRCGVCGGYFNALETLSDQFAPLAAPPPAAEPGTHPAVTAAATEPAESTVERPAREAPEPALAEPSFVAEPLAVPVEPSLAAAAPEISAPPDHGRVVVSPTGSDTAPPETVIDLPEPQAATAAPSAAGEPAPPPAEEPSPAAAAGALPDLGIIAAEPRPMTMEPAAPSALQTALWTVANILLIAVLLGQYAYFKRDELVQYPELRPWLTRLCATLGCETPLQRDVSRIALANRIVSSHPRQANALLIDVTLVNEASFPQPYPLLELRFSDINNQLIAGRRFRPDEYLPPGAALQAGMAPRQPLHITLEIADPGKDAVSFQFELL